MIEHPLVRWFGVLASCLLLISPISGDEDREQLLATARDGNRAAILAITAMECQYERRPWGNTSPEQASKHWGLFSPGRFWRSGEVYRHFKPIGDGTTLDCVVREGRSLGLRKGNPPVKPILSLETLGPFDGVGGAMWQWLLFSHWGWKPPSYYPLDDLLSHPHVIRTAERCGRLPMSFTSNSRTPAGDWSFGSTPRSTTSFVSESWFPGKFELPLGRRGRRIRGIGPCGFRSNHC